jgi:thiol-disulfide isomerase/thioredoxin
MVEQPNEGTGYERSGNEPAICAKCGHVLGSPESLQAPPPGTLLCDMCGAPLREPLAAGRPEGTNEWNTPASPPAQAAKRNPFALVVVALVAAAMLYFGFHMARRSGPTHPLGLAQNTPAPDFTLESLDGKSMRLSDFRGKAVLLNFWATWCGPCKIEMPWFVELQKEYGPDGFQIVGVAMDDSSKDDIAKFAQEMGVNYPVLLGKEAVGDAYGGVPALPESFFISRDGKIVDKIIGLRGRAEIEDSI